MTEQPRDGSGQSRLVWLLLGGLLLVGAGVVVVPELAGPRRCIVAGTLVATPDGPRPIEALRCGDRVWSRAASGERVPGLVVDTFEADAGEHLELALSRGGPLRATAPHPVGTVDGRWVQAGALRVGDEVVGQDGPARVLAVRAVPGTVRVHDLTVDPHACFFAAGVLVHNKHSPESAAIGALKTINTSQTLFREGDKENDGTLDYGNLQELSDTLLIDGVLGSGEKQGYRFEVAASAHTPEFLWFATANPIRPGVTGDRYFATNHAGVIYYRLDRPWTLNSGDCMIPTTETPVGK